MIEPTGPAWREADPPFNEFLRWASGPGAPGADVGQAGEHAARGEQHQSSRAGRVRRRRRGRAGLLASADESWARAEAGEPIDRALQARAFLAAQHCSDAAVDVCATAHRLGGGAAAYRTSPLLRALRDVETARQHQMFSRGLRPHLAPTLAGTDEAHPPFVS